MSDRSKIEWTDASWNPIRARNLATGKIGWHCVHASEGCRNCYAETFNKRLGTGLDYKPGNSDQIDIFLDEKMLLQPLHWKRPRKIFVGSMTDLFADFVQNDMLDKIFAVMALCPQHTFQLLTKRPERMREYLTDGTGKWDVGHACGRVALLVEKMRASSLGMPPNGLGPVGHLEPGSSWWPLSNVWLGVTCEDQTAADTRIPDLLATPAAKHFISAEPLLGPIELGDIPWSSDFAKFPVSDDISDSRGALRPIRGTMISWVICGGESGPNARPMHPDWARSLRDQCDAADVPFFFKQWGAFVSAKGYPGWIEIDHVFDDGFQMIRVGKLRAGRLLDGVEHNEFPPL